MFDQVFDDPTQAPRHTGIGTLIDISDSHTVGLVPIEDIGDHGEPLLRRSKLAGSVLPLEGQPSSSGPYVSVGNANHFAAADGGSHFLVPGWNYELLIQSQGYVPVRIPVAAINSAEVVSIPELTLPFGDAYGDGRIGILESSQTCTRMCFLCIIIVVPAKAGIQKCPWFIATCYWISAIFGMKPRTPNPKHPSVPQLDAWPGVRYPAPPVGGRIRPSPPPPILALWR